MATTAVQTEQAKPTPAPSIDIEFKFRAELPVRARAVHFRYFKDRKHELCDAVVYVTLDTGHLTQKTFEGTSFTDLLTQITKWFEEI
jgi:hypothetical protein